MDPTTRAVLPLLPVLVALAETGQVTAAAEVLQMPQPTVSRALARLGQQLGVDVVERQGRGIRLTAAGKALVPHAAAAVEAARAGVEAIREREASAKGTLSLVFQSTLGERVVPALVGAFAKEHPGVRFDLTQTSRPGCLAMLAEETAEIALISPFADSPELTTFRLHVEPLVLLVPKGHRLATRPRISFETGPPTRPSSVRSLDTACARYSTPSPLRPDSPL